ncbi:energy-coupling factor ABC transporter permease [Candidatus Leptofilum sp.]|uniref:energy-coupling factor ABC transporter permease n=1 Tax=Candidatus Leptofilum sp. TaxID=3241576 RepID=UPI003B5AA7EB
MLTSFPAAVQLLHVPDGFLNVPISVICWVVTLIVLYFAVKQAQQDFDERLVPLAGIMAAFIFAGQMLQFPVLFGISGHLVGATLAFVVLGPWVGTLAMTAVISLQALIFQDGGLVVMGANILIMGIVPGFVGYGVYQMVKDQSREVKLGITAVAAWFSVLIAALVTALLLGFSGTTALGLAIPAMLGVHALIGIGEALITVAALSFIIQTRPQLLTDDAPAGSGKWIVSGIILALLVLLLAPFASGSPDGLEWVAEQSGFIGAALEAPYELLPDYTIPGMGESGSSTILAGLIGALVVAAVTFGIGRILRRQN